MTAAITASAGRRRGRPHHVVMLAYPDVQILDVTGPLEVFSRAARWMQDHGLRRDLAYRVEVVAPRAGAFLTSSGIKLVAERAYREVTSADTLLVAGGRGCVGGGACAVAEASRRPVAVQLLSRGAIQRGRRRARAAAVDARAPRQGPLRAAPGREDRHERAQLRPPLRRRGGPRARPLCQADPPHCRTTEARADRSPAAADRPALRIRDSGEPAPQLHRFAGSDPGGVSRALSRRCPACRLRVSVTSVEAEAPAGRGDRRLRARCGPRRSAATVSPQSRDPARA